MFFSWPLAIISFFFEASLGVAIGLIEINLFYRSRLTRSAKIWSIVLGVFSFLSGAFVSGWAGEHSYFFNGKRMDTAPWGEDLWLRNRLDEYGFLLSVFLETLAMLIAYLLLRRASAIRPPNS